MKVAVKTLDNTAAGEIDLADSVFGLPSRADLLARVVRWQLARRQQGTHDTKEIGEISGGGAKPRPQKGSGRSRHGSTRSPQWRKGAVIFGPTPRSHAIDLPKKVRALGLKTALSSKLSEGKLVVLDSAALGVAKTKDVSREIGTEVSALSNVAGQVAKDMQGVLGALDQSKDAMRAASDAAGLRLKEASDQFHVQVSAFD